MLTLQELSPHPKSSGRYQALCEALFSETGRKLFPKRSREEYNFEQTSATGWPSRIGLTYQSQLPWSVVMFSTPESILLKTYGLDLSTPIETVEVKQIPKLRLTD